MTHKPPAAGAPAENHPAVGIVVHGETPVPERPRSVAFVWGGETLPAPSLPFGRWKPGVQAA
ncbi:MAG TPA: hypothetical protein VFQ45_18995 [Longimicrobium sp.]|nr:hypothetical protein [Longimicrobium sp.]